MMKKNFLKNRICAGIEHGGIATRNKVLGRLTSPSKLLAFYGAVSALLQKFGSRILDNLSKLLVNHPEFWNQILHN